MTDDIHTSHSHTHILRRRSRAHTCTYTLYVPWHAASTYSTSSHPSPNHPKHAPTHTHDTAALLQLGGGLHTAAPTRTQSAHRNRERAPAHRTSLSVGRQNGRQRPPANLDGMAPSPPPAPAAARPLMLRASPLHTPQTTRQPPPPLPLLTFLLVWHVPPQPAHAPPPQQKHAPPRMVAQCGAPQRSNLVAAGVTWTVGKARSRSQIQSERRHGDRISSSPRTPPRL